MTANKPLKPAGMGFWLRLVYWNFLLAYYIVYGPIFWWRNKHAKGDSSIGQILFELSRLHTQDAEDENFEEAEIVENKDSENVVALLEAPRKEEEDKPNA